MSTPVTPLAEIANKWEAELSTRPMAKADEFLRANLPNELRLRPEHQKAIHLSWTELTKLLRKYHDWRSW